MGSQGGGPDAYTVRSVDRAVDILKAFTQEQPVLTLGQVAERVQLAKPTVFRLLATLQQRGMVAQDRESGTYSLGFEVLALAAIRSRQTGVWQKALPFLRRVREALNETVVLAVRDKDHRIVLHQVESSQPIRRIASVGERVPLYVGASSKVLLASMEDDEVDDYLRRTPLVQLGRDTVTDPDLLRKQITLIRGQGYAEGHDERNIGGHGFAVPIRDSTGCVVAAIQVTVPAERCTKEVRTQCIQVLTKTGRALSHELGYREQSSSSRSATTEADVMLAEVENDASW